MRGGGWELYGGEGNVRGTLTSATENESRETARAVYCVYSVLTRHSLIEVHV